MASTRSFPGLGRRGVVKELVTYGHRLTRTNLEHLRRVAAASHCTYTRALNHELDFAREWGVPAPIAARVDVEARQRGLLPKQFVTALVRREAIAAGSVAAKPESDVELAPLTSAKVTPPNHAFLKAIIESERITSLAVIDVVIEYCRTYGLSPAQLAAFETEAARRGVGSRDFVRMLIWREVSPTRGSWVDAPPGFLSASGGRR